MDLKEKNLTVSNDDGSREFNQENTHVYTVKSRQYGNFGAPGNVGPHTRAHRLPPEDDIRTFMSQKPPDYDWVIEGLEPGQVGVLHAPPGTGKSMLCLSIIYAVASGTDLFGQWTVSEAGDVLYLYADDDSRDTWRRMYGLEQLNAAAHIPTLNVVKDRMHMICMTGTPQRLMVSGVGHGSCVAAEPDIEEIARRLQGYVNPRLLIIDPLIKFHALNENDNNEMHQFFERLIRLARELSIAILVVHHTGKAAITNGMGGEQEAVRGASSITGAARIDYALMPLGHKQAKALGIEATESGRYVVLKTAKINSGPALGRLLLERSAFGGVLMLSGKHTGSPPLQGGGDPKPQQKKGRPGGGWGGVAESLEEGVPIDYEE